MHKYLKHEQEFVLTMHTSNIYKNNKIAFLFFHSGSYMRLDTSINVLKHASVKKRNVLPSLQKPSTSFNLRDEHVYLPCLSPQ